MNHDVNPLPTRKVEIIASIIFLTGLLFKVAHWPFAGPMLVVSLGTLACVYVIDGFQIVSNQNYGVLDNFQTDPIEEEKPNSLLNILTGFLLAIACIGILYRLMYWPFSHPLLSVASLGLPVVFGWLYIVRSKVSSKDTSKKYLFKLIRVTIFFAFAATLYFTSLKTQIDIENREDPEMARLKYRSYSNPTNAEYKEELERYRKSKR